MAIPILLTAALVWTHVSLSAAQTANRRKPLESTVDVSVKPGDDFFAYANGAWLKATSLPAEKERWGTRDDAASAAPAGSAAHKVADFRAAYFERGCH
jgi:predicted metalloendopeptidase